jgi:Spy/CpxP family protein refolding chaperone
MKRLIATAILGTAVGTAPVAAQPARHGPPEGRRGHRASALVEYLGLSAEQQEQWRALHHQHWEAMKPLREEGRTLRQRVRESLEANEPEVVVGEAVKALHAHRQQMQKAREAFESELRALLTDEQKAKLDAFQAARRAGGKGRPGWGHRRGGRPGRGPAPQSPSEG